MPAKVGKAAFLEVKVGDRLRDCDPRTSKRRAVREIVAVSATEVRLRRGNRVTTVSRLRVHDNPTRRTGYYLLPPE